MCRVFPRLEKNIVLLQVAMCGYVCSLLGCSFWILGKTSLCKGYSCIGPDYSGKWLCHHPWGYLKVMQIWCLGIWFSGGAWQCWVITDTDDCWGVLTPSSDPIRKVKDFSWSLFQLSLSCFDKTLFAFHQFPALATLSWVCEPCLCSWPISISTQTSASALICGGWIFWFFGVFFFFFFFLHSSTQLSTLFCL